MTEEEELGAARMFTLRLTNVARRNAEQLIRSGWATTLTGAVHYALALASKQDKEKAA